MRTEYLRWKRKNVALRGTNSPSGINHDFGYASMGKGIYTAALSNKALAKQYGKVFFVLNALPKTPLKFDRLFQFEIWLQEHIAEWNTKNGIIIWKYDGKVFFEKTSIEQEVMKRGYDGITIKGRESVLYNPTNVLYFKTEKELYNYYQTCIVKNNM